MSAGTNPLLRMSTLSRLDARPDRRHGWRFAVGRGWAVALLVALLAGAALHAARAAECSARLSSDANNAPALILQGLNLRNAGKLDAAEAKWRQALALDPQNDVIRHYLRQLGRTVTNTVSHWPEGAAGKLPVPAAGEPVSGGQIVGESIAEAQTRVWARAMSEARNARKGAERTQRSPAMSEKRERVERKLDEIKLGMMTFHGVPLSHVLTTVSSQAKERDPDGRGVDLILKLPARADPKSEQMTTGLHAADITPTVRVPQSELGLTLRQMLDYLTQGTHPPVKYTVQDYGVMFSSREPGEQPPLHTRTFKVNSAIFAERLKGLATSAAGNSAALSGLEPQDVLVMQLRAHLAALGAPLDPPKSVHFNDRHGMLMVRAALPDFDVVEQAVQSLNMGAPPTRPQVRLDVQVLELTEEAAQRLNLSGSLAAHASGQAQDTAASIGPGASAATQSGTLKQPLAERMLKTLRAEAGVSVLAMPQVITLSERQAQVKTVEVRTIVTALAPPPKDGAGTERQPITEPFELGPVVDVVPFIQLGDTSIHLTAIGTVKEFVGYDPSAAPEPAPLFRHRQVLASAPVPDGETLFLCGGASTVSGPSIATPAPPQSEFVAQAEAAPRKLLLVFVTPTEVDATGKRVRNKVGELGW